MPLAKMKTVEFDPAKKEHRAAAKAFLIRKAWSDSPIRFERDPDYNQASVAEQVQSKLLEYYMSRDKLVVPKREKSATHVGTLIVGAEDRLVSNHKNTAPGLTFNDLVYTT